MGFCLSPYHKNSKQYLTNNLASLLRVKIKFMFFFIREVKFCIKNLKISSLHMQEKLL